MTDQDKAWIDNASYETLLQRWRFAPVGDLMFTGDTGEYYAQVMKSKREAHPNPPQVSKNLGWSEPV